LNNKNGIKTVHSLSFLPTILELYSEIALSQKPFRTGHMYIHTFMLKMADIMTSQNIDLYSWDILYNSTFQTFPFKETLLHKPIKRWEISEYDKWESQK
jgi:hypothetical protein